MINLLLTCTLHPGKGSLASCWKSEVLRAEGAGIGVQANGWRALEQLGVAGELRKTAGLITSYVPNLTTRSNYVTY